LVLNLNRVYNGQKPMMPVNRMMEPKMYASHIQVPEATPSTPSDEPWLKKWQ